ncbi:MAG: CBS domain-containing protein [Thermoleophilia bacterium]
MRVEDVMTREVVTVSPETSLHDVAALLAGRGISGAPVVDAAGTLLGVVSEGDILVREQGTRERRGGLLGWLLEPDDGWQAPKLAARTAGDAMSSPVVSVGPRVPVSRAAQVMVDENVNRLPVVDGGRLVGIVSRADLVRSFVRTDAEIERAIREDVLRRQLWTSPDAVSVTVQGGDVTISGEVENRVLAEVVPALVQRIPGVISVDAKLTWPA